MKTLMLTTALLLLSIIAKAQTPASTVYDPINNAQLVSMGTMLVTLKEQGSEVVKTLETANCKSDQECGKNNGTDSCN